MMMLTRPTVSMDQGGSVFVMWPTGPCYELRDNGTLATSPWTAHHLHDELIHEADVADELSQLEEMQDTYKSPEDVDVEIADARDAEREELLAQLDDVLELYMPEDEELAGKILTAMQARTA